MSNKKLWTTTVCMEDVGEVENFKDAVRIMMDNISLRMSTDNNFSWQVLETTCWIKHKDEDQTALPFPMIRDIACDLGWIVDGKLNFGS